MSSGALDKPHQRSSIAIIGVTGSALCTGQAKRVQLDTDNNDYWQESSAHTGGWGPTVGRLPWVVCVIPLQIDWCAQPIYVQQKHV